MHRKLIELIGKLLPVKTIRRKIRCSAGLTLTEVAMASALLTIGMVPIIKALTSAHLATTKIEHKSRSLILAQAKLDYIRARSIYHYSESFTESDGVLEGSYLCNVEDSAVNGNLRKITVSVGFDANGDSTLASGEIEITLASYCANRWN